MSQHSKLKGWHVEAPDYSSEVVSEGPLSLSSDVETETKSLSRLKKLEISEGPLSLSSDIETETKPLSRLKKKELKKGGLKKKEPKKKETFSEKKGNISGRYEFQKEDKDEFVETDEESYSSEISEKTRRKMGLKNRQVALYDALMSLHRGDWGNFLNAPIIKKEFAPALALIENCGRGDKANMTNYLWKLSWAGKLNIYTLKKSILKEECVSCAQDRDLKYAFYKAATPESSEELIGYMGPACYTIRFLALLKLIDTTKEAANTLAENEYQPGSDEFFEFIIEPIESAKDQILKAFEKMSKVRRY